MISNPIPWEIGRVVRSSRYRVIKPFVDNQNDSHAVGEEWLFLGTMFDRMYDLYTICVRFDSGEEWGIELRSDRRFPGQHDVLENFLDYVAPVAPDGTATAVPPRNRIQYMRLVTITPSAADYARDLCDRSRVHYLRISTKFIDSKIVCGIYPVDDFDRKNNLIDEQEGFAIVIDYKNMISLKGATLDCRRTPDGGQFTIIRGSANEPLDDARGTQLFWDRGQDETL